MALIPDIGLPRSVALVSLRGRWAPIQIGVSLGASCDVVRVGRTVGWRPSRGFDSEASTRRAPVTRPGAGTPKLIATAPVPVHPSHVTGRSPEDPRHARGIAQFPWIFYRSFYPAPKVGAEKGEDHEGLRGTQGNRWYAVIYEGLDPVTGRERRSCIQPAQIGRKRNGWPPVSPPSSTDETTRLDRSASAPT